MYMSTIYIALNEMNKMHVSNAENSERSHSRKICVLLICTKDWIDSNGILCIHECEYMVETQQQQQQKMSKEILKYVCAFVCVFALQCYGRV